MEEREKEKEKEWWRGVERWRGGGGGFASRELEENQQYRGCESRCLCVCLQLLPGVNDAEHSVRTVHARNDRRSTIGPPQCQLH